MSSCFGALKKPSHNPETDPLLPLYNDPTSLQRSTHQKLHSYQQFRALSKGYMPSTAQTISNLRTLLSSDILNPNTLGLSESGKSLVKLVKQWLKQFIELLGNKNRGDEVQDFIWGLLGARVSVDAGDILRTAERARGRAEVSAGLESLKAVASLLLTNSSFRLFLSDLTTISRQVFADTATTLSTVAHEAAQKIEPSTAETTALQTSSSEPQNNPIETGEPSTLQTSANEIVDVITNGLTQTTTTALTSTKSNLTTPEIKRTMFAHLKAAITRLTKKPDYSSSVETLSTLLQRYAQFYSRAADQTISTVQEDISTNESLDKAIRNGWSLLSSFGEKKEWNELERRMDAVMAHAKKDPEFENMMQELAASIKKMLTDPEFFEEGKPEKVVGGLKEKYEEVGDNSTESDLKKDMERLLKQGEKTFHSILNDGDISDLISTTLHIWEILNPVNTTSNTELFADSYQIFIPMLITAIQYIPIPRLEISTPEIDILLENLILEPGKTVNNSSFLPFKMKVETYNDLTIFKRRFRTVSTVASLVTVKVQGMSIRAEEVGFWMRAHKGLIRLSDAGIASFELDERGIDIEMDVEVGKDRLEKVLSLRNVRVKIHNLSYTLRRSKFAFLAWLFKPLLRPIIRKVLEAQLANAITEFIHNANREVLFARERLRATRISDPKDIITFIKAVITRLTPDEDPDLYAAVGIQGTAQTRGSVFAGVYAPGSVVKLWEEEARRAGEIVDENAGRGWRNEIFDLPTVPGITSLLV